ncbi:MAG: sugar phosphate isomerase/epimerase [Gammaproteobacteria bacterium]|nr:sugar phosphate isomerase/epimerase [Gammaproteobacteria bacterium]
MRRRSLIKAGGGLLLVPPALAGCQSSGSSTAAAQSQVQTQQVNKLDKFGLQLSTVTPLLLADFEGTLARVAQIGYQQVEFSAMGFLGRSPATVQRLLASNGLAAPVGRVTPQLPSGFFSLPRQEMMQVYRDRGQPKYFLENVAHSLESALALGQGYLILPALMPDNFQSLDQVKRNIDLISRAGELCASQGVVFGYHNHNWELAPIDGAVPYDLMLDGTDPGQVTFQLDAYWIRKGGGNLSDYLSRYPGRFSTCHMKDIDGSGDFADVGDGLIDFPKFTREALAQGAKYFFVERDNPPDPAGSIQRSFTYLQQMTF